MKLGCREPEPVNNKKTIMNKLNEFWETENLDLSEIEHLVLKNLKSPFHSMKRLPCMVTMEI